MRYESQKQGKVYLQLEEFRFQLHQPFLGAILIIHDTLQGIKKCTVNLFGLLKYHLLLMLVKSQI